MKTIKILLVEDHLIAQKMVSLVLGSLNCQVEIAADGKTALEKSQMTDYDLILMDIGLPDIDGHTVTEKIRKNEKNTRRVPIVALTAHADESEKTKASRSGMDGL
jgi:CheY-like chemotaxis protein